MDPEASLKGWWLCGVGYIEGTIKGGPQTSKWVGMGGLCSWSPIFSSGLGTAWYLPLQPGVRLDTSLAPWVELASR